MTAPSTAADAAAAAHILSTHGGASRWRGCKHGQRRRTRRRAPSPENVLRARAPHHTNTHKNTHTDTQTHTRHPPTRWVLERAFATPPSLARARARRTEKTRKNHEKEKKYFFFKTISIVALRGNTDIHSQHSRFLYLADICTKVPVLLYKKILLLI